MATINEITSGAQYRGDAALGGGVSVGITVDPSPLARLTTFTYYRDRDFWEKKQKEDVMAARQIADIAAYDVNSPFKEYTQDLTKDLTKLRDYFRNTPDASVYNPNNPQAYMDGQEMLGKFSNKRKHATANDVLYNSAKAKLDLIPDAQTREREMRALGIRAERLFSNGVEDAYNQQFEVVPPPTPEKSIIPSVSMTTRSMIVPLPNSNIINEITYGDPEDLMAKSIMQAAGGDVEAMKTQEWFKKMSPAEQKYELEKAGSTKLAELESTAVKINNLMGEWAAQAGGNIDVETIDLNKLPNNSFGDNIRSARAVNDQIDELNLLVLQGKIPDPSGAVRTKLYSKIPLNDGFSSAELIFLKSLQESKNPLIQKVGKTISNNDNAIQAMQIATARRGQDLDYKVAWHNATKSPAASGGGTAESGITTPAILFGEHIDRLKNYFNSHPGGGLEVSYKALDEKTRGALKIDEVTFLPKDAEESDKKDENKRVIYKTDGSFVIQIEGKKGKWENAKVGTVEDLKQGFINVVKGGAGGDGTQTKEFQDESEKGFNSIFGTTSGSTIFKGWANKPESSPTKETDADYYKRTGTFRKN